MATFDVFLQRIINLLFLGLFFFLPLIFWIPNSEVFELPKMYFVYAVTTLITGLWIARMIVRREILIRRTPLDIPVLLFLLSQIASTIYSIDPHVSWFGWYGRFNGGLLSTISYVLLYYALVSNIVNSKQTTVNGKRGNFPIYGLPFTVYPIIVSSIIVSLYALLQHFGIDRNFWVQDVTNRVFSTQGQPNWLGAYLVMVIPLVWVGIVNKVQRTKINGRSLTAYCLLFTALLFTKSRSGLLGFAVADIVFWTAILVNRFNSSSRVRSKATNREIQRSDRNDGRHFLTIHFLMAILVLTTNNPIQETLFKNRITTSSADWLTPRNDGIPRKSEFGGTESGDIRKLVWSGALKIARQNPIFGTGPETFGLTYWQARPKEANLTSEWNFLYNKAHNEWLNLAANTGILGLGAHLLLVIWFTIWALKGPALREQQGRALLNYAILAGLLGVETVNFFGFSTVTTETYRYLFMGMTVVIMVKSKEQRVKSNKQKNHLPFTIYCLLFTVFLTTLYSIVKISRLYSADLNYNLGRQFYSAGVVGGAINPLYRAVELTPGEPVFRNELAETLSAAAVSIWTDGDKNQAIEVKNEAVAYFKIVSSQSKYNLTFIRTQTQMEFLMRKIDPSLTDESLELAQKAIDLSPTDPRGYYLLGRMYEELDEKQKAKELYRKTVELKPDYEEARKAILNL